MKQVNALELTVLATAVTAVATGCANSGYARYEPGGGHPTAAISAEAGAGVSPSVSSSAYRTDTTIYDPLATDRDRTVAASASMGTDHDASMRASGYNNNIAQVQAGATGTGAAASAEVGAGTGASAQVNTYPPSAQINAGAPAAGVSASADMGASADVNTGYYQNGEYVTAHHAADREKGSARITVSALSFSPETRPEWVNKFPFYSYNLRNVGETFIFAVPDRELQGAVHAETDLPQFSVNLPPGSVFVESAGGAGDVRTGRVIQHSPNPSR